MAQNRKILPQDLGYLIRSRDEIHKQYTFMKNISEGDFNHSRECPRNYKCSLAYFGSDLANLDVLKLTYWRRAVRPVSLRRYRRLLRSEESVNYEGADDCIGLQKEHDSRHSPRIFTFCTPYHILNISPRILLAVIHLGSSALHLTNYHVSSI